MANISHTNTMAAHLENYLNYLLHERNLSFATVKLRKCLLSPFIRWLEFQKIEFNELSVKEYMQKLSKIGSKPDTVNVFLQAVRCFCKYLTENNHGDYARVLKIPRLNLKPSLPEYLTVDEMRALITAPTPDPFKMRKVWDNLFKLLAVTALRISEATGLTWKNIAQNNCAYWIHIRNGKTGDRTILLPECCHTIFGLKNEKTNLIFTNRFGKRITVNSANEQLQLRAKWLGWDKKVHCHLFRHGALTYYASKGKTTHELAALSGHTKSSTLDKYVHLSGYDTQWLSSEVPF